MEDFVTMIAFLVNPYVYVISAGISFYGFWKCDLSDAWAKRTLLWCDLLLSLVFTFCPILNTGTAVLWLLMVAVTYAEEANRWVRRWYWRFDPLAFLTQPVRRPK